MRTFSIIIFLFTLTLSAVAQKQQPQKDDNGQAILDKFFEQYKTSPEAALKYIFGTNKWMNEESTAEVINGLQGNIDQVGGYIGYEAIKSKKVGSRFRIASYFVYYDRQPMRFTFELYKNNDGWSVWNFKYDSSFDTEIEDSMKLTDWN